MDRAISIYAGFGWAALIILLAVSASRPLKDQPRVKDPRCWCEAFGVRREDCYCVTFEGSAE
jgi:hypothetical protein